MTTTVQNTTALRALGLGTKFDFNGVRYRVIRHKNVNTLIQALDTGKEYNLRASAAVTNVERAATGEALALMYPSLHSTIRMGTPVKIISGRFQGKAGIVAKMTADKYQVAVLNSPTIIVGITSGAVEEITKEELLATL